MYIYRALEDSSRVTEGESLHLQDDSRVVQLEGHLANVIGIRFNPQSSSRSKQPTQQKEGQLADVYGRDQDGTPQYWADKPSGTFGGQRARDAWREDLQANIAQRHYSRRIFVVKTLHHNAFNCSLAVA